jgi:Flp pilus assembly protein TadB
VSGEHIALACLLAGTSAASLTYALLAGREHAKGSIPALLLDAQAMRRALGDLGPGAEQQGFGARMRQAGIGFGAWGLAGLAFLCAALAVPAAYSLTANPSLAALAASMAGLLPFALARARGERREAELNAGFEVMVESLERALKSGLDLRAALSLAFDSAPPALASALASVARGLLLGAPLADCAAGIGQAARLPAAALLAAAIGLHAESGGRIGACLTSICDALRQEKRLRSKLAVASAEARSASLILLLLPILLLAGMAVLAPQPFALLTDTSAGRAALGLAALCALMGFLAMRAMVAAALPKDAFQ